MGKWDVQGTVEKTMADSCCCWLERDGRKREKEKERQ